MNLMRMLIFPNTHFISWSTYCVLRLSSSTEQYTYGGGGGSGGGGSGSGGGGSGGGGGGSGGGGVWQLLGTHLRRNHTLPGPCYQPGAPVNPPAIDL